MAEAPKRELPEGLKAFFARGDENRKKGIYDFKSVVFEPREEPCTERYMGTFSWSCDGVGFGQVTICRKPDGGLYIDSECMSKDFLKAMLSYWVDNAELDKC